MKSCEPPHLSIPNRRASLLQALALCIPSGGIRRLVSLTSTILCLMFSPVVMLGAAVKYSDINPDVERCIVWAPGS